MKTKFTNTEVIDEIIKEYKNGKNCRQLALEYGGSNASIHRLLLRNGVQCRKNGEDKTLIANTETINEIIKKYKNGKSCYELGSEYDCSFATIQRLLRRNGIQCRKKWEHSTLNISNTELSDLEKQIIQGMLLGDGSVLLSKVSSYFTTTSKDKEFTDHLKGILSLPGWRTYIRDKKHIIIKGRKYNCEKNYTITSRTDKSLGTFRNEWYPEGIKIVPRNLELTPTIIKYWFYGDGSTSFVPYRDVPDARVRITFCTNGFTHDDCEFLVSKLDDLSFKFTIQLDKGKPILVALQRNTTTEFCNYMGECNLPCFDYKWKKPTDNYKYQRKPKGF